MKFYLDDDDEAGEDPEEEGLTEAFVGVPVSLNLDRPSTSALTYGRQNFIPILVKVAVMLKKINPNTFNPDAQASRIVRAALAAMEQESTNYEEQMGVSTRAVDQDESASDVEDQEGLEMDVGQLVPPDERRLVQLESPDRFEQHRLSGILHLISSDSKFACGRSRTMSYLPAEAGCTLGSPVCEQCRATPLFNRGGESQLVSQSCKRSAWQPEQFAAALRVW